MSLLKPDAAYSDHKYFALSHLKRADGDHEDDEDEGGDDA